MKIQMRAVRLKLQVSFAGTKVGQATLCHGVEIERLFGRWR